MSNIWLGSNGKVIKYGSGVRVCTSGLPAIAPKTLRFKFADSFNPTTDMPDKSADGLVWTHVSGNVYDFSYSGTNWTNAGSSSIFDLFSYIESGSTVYPMAQHVFDIIDSDLTGVENISYMFKGARQINRCVLKHLESIITATQTFGDNRSNRTIYLTYINDLYMPELINAQQMFGRCRNMVTPPAINAAKLENASLLFSYCTGMTSMPSLTIPAATKTNSMFVDCTEVASGIYSTYQYLSTKTVPVTTYYSTFSNCGSNTVTGAAELAQIPSSWGGTGA